MMQCAHQNSTDNKGLIPFFDRDTTNIIKGLAIIMMFVESVKKSL